MDPQQQYDSNDVGTHRGGPSSGLPIGGALRARLASLFEDGWALWDRFDTEVRRDHWHPFVPADYSLVLEALLPLRAPGVRFLEWGSATGVVTIMADLLGFDATGIEIDAQLVGMASELARRYESGARFAAGSFVPAGYRWRPATGDGRPGTIGDGTSAYPSLGHPLEDFDIVYAYPWIGEEAMMLDLMRCYGRRGARLVLHENDGVRIYKQ